MKKKFTRTLAVFLSLAMIISTSPFTVFAVPSEGIGSSDTMLTGNEATGTVINFGSYPQSRVTNSSLIASLDAMQKNWVSYDYYLMSDYGNTVEQTNYMRYADIVHYGQKYRAVTFSEYRNFAIGSEGGGGDSCAENSWQDDNGYVVNTVYYFKYEPLQWIVLDAEAGLIMCANAIDAREFHDCCNMGTNEPEYFGDVNERYYSSDWSNSSLRAWLNDDFYNTAFTSTQQSDIQTTALQNGTVQSDYYSGYVCTDTNDKIFLLSYWDAKNPAYGFNASGAGSQDLDISPTDYAQCQGAYNDLVWLRTFHDSWDVCTMQSDGYVSHSLGENQTSYSNLGANFTEVGVAPVLRLSVPVSNLGYSVNSVTVSDGPVEEGQYEVVAYSTISGECLLRVTFYDAVTDEFSTSGDCYYDELMLQSVSSSSPKTVNAAILFYPRDIPANYVVRACLCNLEETEVYAGYGPTSGKCGTNLTWSLNTSTGVLTISGTGAMYDYNDYIEAPWFYFMNSIRSVVIESGVTSISECAFERVAAVNHSGTCGANATWSLNTVTGVLNIDGTGAMSDYSYDYDGINTPWNSWADSINTVNIGSGITRVGNMTFCDCYYVTEVNLPDGLTSIGNYVFEGCGITDVTIPSSVTAIGECAFAACHYLTDVDIPSGVTSIGNMAFHECGSLTAFTVDSNNANYSSDEYGVLYNKAKTLLIQYPNGDCSTEFTVPDSVTTIGNYAFANNDTLTNVTLPEGLTIINGSAFFGSELEYVHIPTTVIFIGNSAFDTNNLDFYLCSNPRSDVVFEYADDNDIPYTVCEHGVSEPEPCPTAVTVSGPGSVTYNGIENHNEQMLFTEPGAKIDLVANEGAENNFLYWVNAETNRVLSFENEYSFTVSPGTRIQARFYEPESEGNHMITYLSNAGNIIEEFDVPVGVTVTPPTPTKLPGYNFTGWSMSAEDASLTSENVVITPNYTKLSGTFTVTITNASGTRGAGTYERDSVATVSALGENFSYWVDANNEKVSYYPTYSFTVICDTVLTAVYNQPESESTACRISNVVQDTEGGALTVYEEWSVGKKYEVDSTGFVFTLNPTVGADDSALRIGGTNVNKTTSKYHTRNGVYSLTLTGWNSGKTVYIRPYVVISDSTGQHTIYGNIRSYTAAA